MRLPPVMESVFVATVFCLGVGLGREFVASVDASVGLAHNHSRLMQVVREGVSADDVQARTVFDQTQTALEEEYATIDERWRRIQ